MHRFTPVLLAIFGVFSLLFINAQSTPYAQAATSNTVNFQARLQTVAGAIVPDGTYNVEFKLYSASSGGVALWTEDYLNNAAQGMTTVNGYLSTGLGTVTPFPGTINWDQQLWLTMTVRGSGGCASFAACSPADAEMAPRLPLTAVPYAFTAGQLATTSGANRSTLSIQAPTVGNQTFVIQDQGAAGTYNLLTTAAAGTGFIQNGVSLQASANFNIDSVGKAATFNATSALQTAGVTRVDASGNLTSIGNITSGAASILSTTAGLLTVQGAGGVTVDASVAGQTIAIGNSGVTHTIAIGTSASAVQGITIGSTNGASATTIQSGTGNINFVTNNSAASTIVKTITNSATAFQVQNAAGQAVFLVDTTSSVNLLMNPGFEVNTTGWAATGTAASIARNVTKSQTYAGIASLAVTLGSVGGTGVQITAAGISGGTQPAAAYTLSFYAKGGAAITGLAASLSGGGTCTLNSTTVSTTGFQRYFCNVTTVGATTSINITATTTGQILYLDAIQLQAGGSLTPYNIGSIQLRGVINSPTAFQNNSNSTTAFQIQDMAGTSNLFMADTLNDRIGVGTAAPAYALDVVGQVNASTGYRFNATAGSTTTCSSGQFMQNQVVQGGIVTAGTCAGGGGGVTLQGSSPGVADVGNFNITGIGIAATLKAADFDRTNAGILTFGNTNATTINIGTNVAAHTIGIGTGAAVQGITIGSMTGASALALFSGTGVTSFDTGIGGSYALKVGGTTAFAIDSTGRALLQPNTDGNALTIKNALGTNNIFNVDTTADLVSVDALQATYSLQAQYLTLTGGSTTTYTTPLGGTLQTKLNVPNYDPGASNSVIALGILVGSNVTARGITVLDARAVAHQPSIGVISPDQNQIFGLSWDGVNTQSYLKTTASNLTLQANAKNILTAKYLSSTTGQVIIGDASAVQGTLSLANSTNANAVNLTSGTTAADYTLQFATGIGVANQCLSIASVAGSVATLGYANCVTSTTSLQGAYDNSSTPASILLANAKNFVITAADTATDPNILFNLQCVTSCSTNGRFAVQNAGTDYLTVNPNSTLVIGSSTNNITFSSNGSYVFNGTSRPSKTITLNAEYLGAVLDAGTGSNNAGTMTSGIDLTNRMNYYNWTTTQGTNQSYDIDVQVPIPNDFDSWASNPLSATAYTTNTTNGTITLETRDTGGTVICNFVSITPGSTITWTPNNTACTLSSGTYTPGGYMTMRIRLQTVSTGNTRIGNIVFSYNSKY